MEKLDTMMLADDLALSQDKILNGEQEAKCWRAKDTDCDEFWDPILNDPNFELACNKRFKLSRGDINASNLEDLDEELDYNDIDIDE